MNEDQEDRRRIVNALAAHTFNKMAEGDEVRVYDISTDSFWFVGRKNGRMAWRPETIEPSEMDRMVDRLAALVAEIRQAARG